jgi:hypothetical protein
MPRRLPRQRSQWVMADPENGLFAGANGTNLTNTGRSSAFVTGMVEMNSTTYAIKDGNADSGALKTDYNGALPTTAAYTPLHLEGGNILGIGGDNSKSSSGASQWRFRWTRRPCRSRSCTTPAGAGNSGTG